MNKYEEAIKVITEELKYDGEQFKYVAPYLDTLIDLLHQYELRKCDMYELDINKKH